MLIRTRRQYWKAKKDILSLRALRERFEDLPQEPSMRGLSPYGITVYGESERKLQNAVDAYEACSFWERLLLPFKKERP